LTPPLLRITFPDGRPPFMREHIRRFAMAYDLDTRSDVATAESVEKSPNGGG
jgi:hypothetical protein